MTPTKRVFAYIWQERRRYLIGAVLTLAYTAVFQMVPLAMREVVGRIETGRPLADVEHAALGLMGIAALFATLRFGTRRSLFRVGRHIEYDLRGDFFAHLQRLPQSYFAGQRTGDLMSRAVNDINNVRMFLGMGLLNIVQTPMLYLGAIVMLCVDWRLTLWVLLPYPLFVLIRASSARMHRPVWPSRSRSACSRRWCRRTPRACSWCARRDGGPRARALRGREPAALPARDALRGRARNDDQIICCRRRADRGIGGSAVRRGTSQRGPVAVLQLHRAAHVPDRS